MCGGVQWVGGGLGVGVFVVDGVWGKSITTTDPLVNITALLSYDTLTNIFVTKGLAKVTQCTS